MNTHQYKITINAPKEKVWEAMLGDATYREWTSVFHEGSRYEGEWKEGSKMLFLGPEEDGTEGGMVAMIERVDPYKFVSIKHVGIVEKGVEDTESKAIEGWSGTHENYTFNEVDGGTEVVVDMDVDEKHASMFDDVWPKALEKLKEIAER